MATRPALEDLLDLRAVSDVELSADGLRVAFVVAGSSREDGASAGASIWLGDAQGAAQVTRGRGNDALPHFSPDGRSLAFASDRGRPGLLGLHLLDFTGEARPVGDIAGAVEDIAWSADGSAVLVLAADPGSDRAGALTATRIATAEAETDPLVRRPRETWRRLFRVELESGETSEVSPPGLNVWEFGWNGSGEVAAIVSDDPGESAWYDARVALLDPVARTSRTIYEAEWQLQSPSLSPDGSRVAFVEGCGSDRAVISGTVTIVGGEGGAATTVAAPHDVAVVRWVAGDRLAYVGPGGLETGCGLVTAQGVVQSQWRGPATLGRRGRTKLASSADGRVFAVAKEAPGEPHEVCLLDTAATEHGWRQVTHINAALAGRDAEMRRHAWQAADGQEIEGVLMLPDDGAERPLPLVVFVHGGPTSAWTYDFSPGAMHLGLVLAAEGYAVLLPNIRGSAGRGQEFARANLGDMGGDDLQDILAGIDSLVESGVVARDRVGITGVSYGGFMSAWAPTQTDAFAASVAIASVTNWLSFHNTSNIARFDELFLQSDPYDLAGNHFALSPIMHVRSCRTPMLLLHGRLDLCVPESQAQEMYQALVDAGCESELVVYAQGGHGWTQRDYVLDTWERTLDWFGRHLSS